MSEGRGEGRVMCDLMTDWGRLEGKDDWEGVSDDCCDLLES